MAIQPAPGSADEARIIPILVNMTLDGQLLAALKAVKETARTAAGPGADRVRLKQALTDAVEAELRQRGIMDVTCTQMQQIAADFCDRAVAGIDSWDENSQAEWKRVCDDVIEVSSSDI